MRPGDRNRASRLDMDLLSFDGNNHPLVGIREPQRRDAFIEQLLESMRRVRYVAVIRERQLSSSVADPSSDAFDPIKAAIFQHRCGNVDEAFWLLFLFVHFGKHARTEWRYVRDVYGRLDGGGRWDWQSTSSSPSHFREWLAQHQLEMKTKSGHGGFGNHRKYQSLDAYAPTGTGAVVESYVNWVRPPRSHEQLVLESLDQVDNNPRGAFHRLYRSMSDVIGFGRTAKFDYLTMIGKVGLASIEPGSTYLSESTGPKQGAHLLFGDYPTSAFKTAQLDGWLVELGDHLSVGMQVLEDALCNWQKSPNRFRAFRG